MSQLELALAYAARGWRVFPTHNMVRGQCSCHKDCKSKGKHPRTRNGSKDATLDTDIITAWWTEWPEANIAIATGRMSGIFVVDIDPRARGFESFEQYEDERGAPMPPTLIALTGGGGRHLYFAYPFEAIGGRGGWLPGVDVKSDGGYVIAPASNHESGGYYTWLTDMNDAIVQAPSDLLASIRSNTGGSGKDPLPSAKSILDGIAEGKRDETLFRWACRLRRQHSTDDDGGRTIVEKLVLEAARNCTPEFPREEALRKVEQAFAQDHSDDAFVWDFSTGDGDPIRRLTDLGNANRLIDAYRDDLRYVPAWGWMRWTSIGWERISDEYLNSLARTIPDMIRGEAELFRADDPQRGRNFLKWANDTESSGHLGSIGRLARSDERIMANVDSFDADDFLLACRNGIVDLRTGELRPYTRDDHVTKNTNVVYDPNFRSAVWDQFLHVSTEGDVELMRYLQQAAGYTLTGSNMLECFFIMSGPPASGKSTFLDGLHAAMGLYATSTQSDTFMYKRGQATAKDELARLAGMRLVSVSEVRQGESFNEALIKQLTGGDKITARFLYQDGFEFTPQLKIWLATNHDPDTRDTAMWRRIKKIAFMHNVPADKRDPAVKQTIRDPEIGGRAVLAWAVAGAVAWYKNGGKLEEPVSITNATMAYRMDQDRFATFLDEVVVQISGESVLTNNLYAAYDIWSRTNNEFPMRRPQFTAELRSRGYTVLRLEGTKTQVVQGVSVKPMRPAESGMGMSWG